MVTQKEQIISKVEARKPLVSILYSLLLVFLLTNFVACDKDDEQNPPIKQKQYFVSVDKTKTYNKKELIAEIAKDFSANILSIMLPNSEVKIEKIKYKTKDPQGNLIIASGIISYPTSGEYKGVVLGEHFTITNNAESPSERMFSIESVLSLYQYVVVSPDYIGFGETSKLTHPYLHITSTATVSLDLLFAAREYISLEKTPLKDDIYIIGYSQGGAAALSVQKVAEEKYSDNVHINKVIAGGGAYDLIGIFDYFNKTNKSVYPCSLPYTVVGLNYGDQLNLDYAKLFLEPLLSNYSDWFLTKKHTTSEINQKINSRIVSEFIHPDFFTKEKNSELNKLYASLKKNSLIDWTPKAPILLIHGTSDEVVPYFCAKNAYESFRQKGSKVELKPIESADHEGAALSFYLNVIKEFSNL